MADILEIVNGAIVNKPLTVILCKKKLDKFQYNIQKRQNKINIKRIKLYNSTKKLGETDDGVKTIIIHKKLSFIFCKFHSKSRKLQ